VNGRNGYGLSVCVYQFIKKFLAFALRWGLSVALDGHIVLIMAWGRRLRGWWLGC